MTTRTLHRITVAAHPAGGSGLRIRLAQLDEDQAGLQRARSLLAQARQRADADPGAAFELVHRAALRGAGVLVTRANRKRRRKLPLNVWTALERIGGADRAGQLEPLVAERARLDRDPSAHPDPVLLRRHLEQTADHLEQVAAQLTDELPDPMTALAG